MESGKSSVLTQAIHTLFEVGTVGGMTDGQLLEQFAARKTEAAFVALVARHGPMVLSVCVGLLGDAHDAEDAFQATFLILAKKSSSIRDPNLLGNWLYGVARRTAQKAKARRARWRGRAGAEGAMSSVAVVNGLAELEPVHREETAALHEEVDRLPQSLRAPIVLCYLEGLTHDEAARRLRWPIGTVRSRMARARGLLRARLIRRGLAYVAIAAAIESPRAVMAEVPHALANATARSAIALATGTVSGLVSTPVGTLMEEVLKSMFITQLKRIVAAAVAAAWIATGAAFIAVGALQPQPSSAHGRGKAAQAADQQPVEGNRAGQTTQTPDTPAAGLLGIGRGNRTVLGDEPKVEKPSATYQRFTPPTVGASAPPKKMTVRGRVVDPDGKPVAGATVTTSRSRRGGIGPYGWDADRQEIDRAVSDTAGRFTLAIAETTPVSDEEPGSPDHWSLPRIVAWAPGFGPAWPKTLAKEVTEDMPIQLVPDDVPITGRLVDLEGRPISGASIRVDSLWVPESHEAIDRWRATVERDPVTVDRPRSHYFPIREKLAGGEPAIASARSTTDAEGRFRLSGLGRDRLAILEITGPTIATRRAQVVTRRMNRIEGRHLYEPDVEDPTYFGASPTIVVEPGRPIEGVVLDADTKAPITGAIVTAEQRAGSPMVIEGLIATRTDAQGRYRLAGLPNKGDGHKLSVYPSLEQPYFITDSLKVPAGPGLEPVQFDIALHRGVWITGRVTDTQTGRPVEAAVHYYPYLANQRAQAFPNFRSNTITANWTGHRYRTDSDGRFRVVGLPGRGIVAAKSFLRTYRLGAGTDRLIDRPSRQAMPHDGLPTYNQIYPNDFEAVAEVNPPAGAEEFLCDLKLDPGQQLTIQLVDPEGKALTGVLAWGCFPTGRNSTNLHDESRAQIFGLDPASSRALVFLHSGRKLGAVLIVNGGNAAQDREQTIMLRTCAAVSGRVIDTDGKPVTGGVWVRLDQGNDDRSAADWFMGGPFDADGRFRINNLPPGGAYTIQARDRMVWVASAKKEPERFPSFDLARNLSAKSGKLIDLGTFNATTGKPIERAEKPAETKGQERKAATRTMPITGRIVDLEGRPVGGVTVQITQIQKPKGDILDPWIEAVKRSEPPWTAADNLIDEPPITPEKKRPEATTDAQGRFQLEALDAERVVNLRVQGATIAYNMIEVITRRTEPIPARGFPSQHGPGSQTVYGADFTLTASPCRVVDGVVRDAETKQPMPNVGIWSNTFAGSDFIGTKDLKTTTDEQGRFRLVGLPKGRGNAIIVVPNDDQPYFMQVFTVPDAPGITPVFVEIALHKGIFIEGKVTDEVNGQPIPKAWMEYFPFLENKYAQATPGFEKDGHVPAASSVQDRYQTKSDGTYRLVGLPGRAIIGVVVYSEKPYLQGAGSELIQGMDKHGKFPTYRNPVGPSKLFPASMKEINPPEGTQVVRLDLELFSGAKVRVRVVDPQGRPVTGVEAAGRSGREGHDREPQRAAEFDVVTLAPLEDRMVLVRHKEQKLGRVIHVHEGDDKKGPVVVTVEPLATLTGRILDPDGNSVSGAWIRTDPLPGGDFSLSLSRVASDEDGKFVVPDVPIGCKYTLVVESGIAPKGRRVAFIENASVRPGETTDVGDIRFKND
jgi:RNA polymerase sigma factor (sigma-70 family)